MIYIHDGDLITEAAKDFLLQVLPSKTKFLSLRKILPPNIPPLVAHVKLKTSKILNPAAIPYIIELLSTKISEPVCTNSQAILWYLTAPKKHTLNAARGSVYHYTNTSAVTYPIIIMEPLRNAFFSEQNKWIFQSDLRKAVRYDKRLAKSEPPFQYKLCNSRDTLEELRECSRLATLIAIDCETKPRIITCIGYTFYLANGTCKSFTIPIFDGSRANGSFWENPADETYAWKIIREIHGNATPKIMQGGHYDAAWFIRYNIPTRNYIFDTMVAQYSLYADLPKNLAFLASMYTNTSQVWKDVRGQAEYNQDEYWKYCARDSYYTLLIALNLFPLIKQIPYAWENYKRIFYLNTAICLKMSMRGLKIDQEVHHNLIDIWKKETRENLLRLKIITDNPEFNPEAPNDVAHIIYDIYKMPVTRLQSSRYSKLGKRSTDAKILKIYKEEINHPLVHNFIDALEKYKSPKGNLNKYGEAELIGGRYMYDLSAAATRFGRLSSNTHQFYAGGNSQNFPKNIKHMFRADPGYVYVSLDYSQSDDYFIAFTSQDPNKMEIMQSGLDVHSYHVEKFFGVPYEQVLAGKKSHDPYIVDPKTGLRQIMKKVVHGKNYLMEFNTLLNSIGRDAAIMAGNVLQLDLGSLSHDKLLNVCKILGDKYDGHMGLYNTLRPWQKKEIRECQKNGRLLVCYNGFTRHYFESFDNPETQRDIIAAVGQGGTAGNINKALVEIHKTYDDGVTFMLMNQVHDSIEAQVRKDSMWIIPKLLDIMQTPCVIHGREFVVPVDVEIGLHLGDNMMAWKEGMTYEDVVADDIKKYGQPFY